MASCTLESDTKTLFKKKIKQIMMSSIINDTNLPKCFINKIVSPTDEEGITVVRSGIQNMTDIAKWIKEFGQNTCTHWVVSKVISEGQRIVCSKQYVCQYSSSRKHKEKRGITKDILCPAKINFQIKINTSYTRASDIHIREGLCGVIIIKNKHTHPIDMEDNLIRQTALNAPLKETFFEYFSCGLNVSESIKHYQQGLDNNNKLDNNLNKTSPTERTVRFWHEQWKKLEHLKRRTEIALSKFFCWQANLNRNYDSTFSQNYYQNSKEASQQPQQSQKQICIIKEDDVVIEDRNLLSPPSAMDNSDAISTNSQSLTIRNDESIAFGDYVGLSLSRMEEHIRSVVIHKISKIIFEADMGKLSKDGNEEVTHKN
nr:uncharacterized protein LOC111427723 isoform X1 [Onthophagus taurus]